ncbi:hypothetical protein Avbf_12993 [Armadillidium vulgare]|nr:hypothetical protein Avbf_12993 [Armadillidium vulgare]
MEMKKFLICSLLVISMIMVMVESAPAPAPAPGPKSIAISRPQMETEISWSKKNWSRQLWLL